MIAHGLLLQGQQPRPAGLSAPGVPIGARVRASQDFATPQHAAGGKGPKRPNGCKPVAFLLLLAILHQSCVLAADNGLARTPPM